MSQASCGEFGPVYPHTETVFKRDPTTNVIIPGEWTCDEFAYLSTNAWQFTEKVDGTNIRLHRPADGQGRVPQPVVGGRTDKAQLPEQLVKNLSPYLDLDRWDTVFGGPGGADTTVYGEGYGAGIQSGGAYSAEQRFIVFDVRIGDWWLKRDDVVGIAGALGFDVVPVVTITSLDEAIWWVRNAALGRDFPALRSAWPGVSIEGLVGEPVVPLRTRRGDRIKTKIKVRDWTELYAKAGK